MSFRLLLLLPCVLAIICCSEDLEGPTGTSYATTTETFTVSVGDTLSLMLRSCSSCGYHWEYYRQFSGIVDLIGYDEYFEHPDPELVGQPLCQEWIFWATSRGHATGVFEYWGPDRRLHARHVATILAR